MKRLLPVLGAFLVGISIMAVGALAGETSPETGLGGEPAETGLPGEPPTESASPSSESYPGAPPPFAVPSGGEQSAAQTSDGSVTTMLYREDGSLFAERSVQPTGAVSTTWYDEKGGIIVSVYSTPALPGEPPPGTPAGPDEALTDPSDLGQRVQASCGNNTSNPSSNRLAGTLQWRWVQQSTPAYIRNATTLQALRNARIEWEGNRNWCSIADNSTVDFSYQGTIATSFGQNGVSTIGWGNVQALPGCSATAIACTASWGSPITESDTRMDTDATWVNGQVAGQFDIQHAFAHETGHTAAFGDVTDTTVVMNGGVNAGDTSNRLLGRGDANANNAKY